jgi:hypothetical protein
MVEVKEKLTKHTLNLNEGDFDKISAAFPKQTASVIIRRVVNRFAAGLEQKADETLAEAAHLLAGEELNI